MMKSDILPLRWQQRMWGRFQPINAPQNPRDLVERLRVHLGGEVIASTIDGEETLMFKHYYTGRSALRVSVAHFRSGLGATLEEFSWPQFVEWFGRTFDANR